MVQSVVEETGEHPRPKKTEENIDQEKVSTGHPFLGYYSFSSIPDETSLFDSTFVKGDIVFDVVSALTSSDKDERNPAMSEFSMSSSAKSRSPGRSNRRLPEKSPLQAELCSYRVCRRLAGKDFW